MSNSVSSAAARWGRNARICVQIRGSARFACADGPVRTGGFGGVWLNVHLWDFHAESSDCRTSANPPFSTLSPTPGAQAENYPFCTIDPNVGAVKVPDSRLAEIAALIPPEIINPASMTFVDIAGLVKGASKGEGLGNQFLAHIRETQAIAHVVRCFSAPGVVHVTGGVDPVRDVEIIDTELMLADLSTVTRRYEIIERTARVGIKESVEQFAVLGKVKKALERGQPVRSLDLRAEEAAHLADLHLISAKKVLYVANVDDADSADPDKNPHVKALCELAAREGAPVVPICGKIESEIAELEGPEKAKYLKHYGMAEPGLNRLIRAGYALLGLQTFFTAGPKEVHAWTIRKGSSAPEAAGAIHTDLERGFIKAEVYHYDDLMNHHSEAAIRDAGRMRLEGKDYEVRDGDVIYFRCAA